MSLAVQTKNLLPNPEKAGWRSMVDRDASLWATFVSNRLRYEGTHDESHLRRGDDALFKLFEGGFEPGRYDYAMFLEFMDDAIGGGFSRMRPDDLYADYSELNINLRPLMIKKMGIEEANQAYLDAQYSRRHFSRDQFFLAPVRFEPATKEGRDYALLPVTLILGPDIGEIFRTLNQQIDKSNKDAEKVLSKILNKNLEDLILWQSYFDQTVPQERAVIESDPKTIIDRYGSHTKKALENAERLTYQKDLGLVISDSERRMFDIALKIYHILKLSEEKVARIRDNTDTNSGLELGRIKFRNYEELYSALIKAISKRPENGDIKSDSTHYTRNGYVISDEKISLAYAHWDPATGKFGHFLEDFWRIVDSYSLDIGPYTRDRVYKWFIENKFGSDAAEEHDIIFDAFITRFFRNFRHRDVVISDFARVNEERCLKGSRDEQYRDNKRVDYTSKAEHYLKMSVSALDEGITTYDIECSEADRLSFHYNIGLHLLSYIPTLPRLQLQQQLDDTVQEMTKVIENTGNAKLRELAQLSALSYITCKMSYFKGIRFDKLTQS